MKILYAAFKYDYADKSRGFSYEHFNFWGTLSLMYGDKVIYFPVDEKIMELGRSQMNAALLDAVEKENPDVLFCNLFTNEIKPKTIKTITRGTKTVTVNWFSDDQWRFDNFSRYWAPFFDWVTTTDPHAVNKYHNIGYSNVIKSQYAANTQIYKPVDQELKYQVSFIGRRHGSRGEFIEFLKKNDVSVECWGNGWPRGRISQEEMIKIFSQSRINLNFSEVSTSARDVKTILKTVAKVFLRRGINNTYHFFPPSIIFRNIINFYLPKASPQIKGRNFEIPACGGFLLTQEAEDLHNFYECGKEIEVFTNKDDLLEKVNYYLAHEEERKRIAEAGYERTMKDHTWERRFSEIFKIILEGGKRKS